MTFGIRGRVQEAHLLLDDGFYSLWTLVVSGKMSVARNVPHYIFRMELQEPWKSQR
jgi:hypothetical protein